MTFSVDWSRWNRGHLVIFLGWAIPLTQVVTRDAGEPRRRLRSKKSYKMKRAWGTSDVGRFFVTGPTDVATKPSHFYCRLCRKDVSVLTHGHYEILRHFQGSKHFPRDQRLSLETSSWEMLDYKGNIMSPAEVERQRRRIMRAPLVVRDR